MLTLSRRFLTVMVLLFWQGGFLFYASVVVPAAQQVIGHRQQGFVTREVTQYLNLSGIVALVVLLWEVIAARDRSAPRRRLRAAAWVGMAMTLAMLFWLHPQLDALLDPKGLRVQDPPEFRLLHRAYLWTSTVQWGCGLLFLLWTLAAWQEAKEENGDRATELRH